MKQTQKQASKPAAKQGASVVQKPATVHTLKYRFYDPKEIAAMQENQKPKNADGRRPSSGHLLFAHSMAFFFLTGMDEGKAVPAALIRRVMGQTALNNHTVTTGFFSVVEGDKRVLTNEGRAHFFTRGQDSQQVSDFIKVLSTGQAIHGICGNPAKALTAV